MSTVVYNNSTSNYYILVDQGELNDPTADSGNFAHNDKFKPSFTLQCLYFFEQSKNEFKHEEDLVNAYEETNSTSRVKDAKREFDETDGNVTATTSKNAPISGTTNIAPGTEFTLRLRSTQNTEPRFVKTTVNATADGTFSASFNFSDQQVGDTFSAQVRRAAFDAASDCLVVEVQTETPTETETETEPRRLERRPRRRRKQ